VRRASPLIVGLSNDANFIASDIPAVLAHTRRFLQLEDGEMARLTQSGVELFDAAGRLTEKKSTTGWKDVYTYDDLGRLVKSESGYEDEPAWVETYTYDDKGNITKIVAQSEDYNEGNPITYEIEYKQVFVSENRAKALNAQKDYISGKLMTLAW
jgi:YD repeat-containing protein